MGEQKAKQIFFLDSLGRKSQRERCFDFPLSRYVLKHKKSSVLLAKSGRTESFFTQDSKLYYTPEELRRLRRGQRVIRITNRLDALASRTFGQVFVHRTGREDPVFSRIKERYLDWRWRLENLIQDSSRGMSFARAYNVTIVASVLFGMLLMTMIYRNLGQGVSAKIEETKAIEAEQVLGAAAEPVYEIDDETITKLFREYDSEEDIEFQRKQFEKEIKEMVKGYPIEKMIPDIARHERIVAAFLVAIARKESGWGEHVPVYKGQDCFNYWGWRGKNPVGSGGHTCFASPKEAVDTVAKRIAFLVSNKKLNTPQKMIIWKCGDCSWDTPAAMRSWINDVDIYFRKLNKT